MLGNVVGGGVAFDCADAAYEVARTEDTATAIRNALSVMAMLIHEHDSTFITPPVR